VFFYRVWLTALKHLARIAVPVKLVVTLDTARLQWLGALGIVLACASCIPSPRSGGQLAPPLALTAASAQTPPPLDAETRERVSRKVAQLLVPVDHSPAEPFLDNSQSQDNQERSLNCLTQAIYYEARSEPEDGQRAVAQVVLNRVRHPAFPSTVCGVVFQGHERSTGCQFTFTCDGSMARGVRNTMAWIRAREIASEALNGYVYAPVGNATHYHTLAVHPYWAAYLQKSAIVGSHIFYRWAGSAGEASAFRQQYGGLEPAPALWQSEAASGVTIHRGTTPDEQPAAEVKWREEVALDDGKVTIHRSNGDAQQQFAIEPQPHHEAVREASEFGVRVHSGTPPAIG
jgi:spore germination cell wall hydrolase CwlJ-like protein